MRRPPHPLFAALLLLAACQSDPVTGKRYYSPLGNDYASQDRFIRENFIAELRVAADGGLLPEPEVAAACAEIFERVAAAVPAEHRRGFTYHFALSASPDVNAYTYGGGRVHCHLGLLARCNDAAEFAGVMAHEIGHNSHDHFGQGLGRERIAGSVLGIGGIAGRPGRKLFESIGGLVAGVTLVQHTRAQEKEADVRAVEYTLRAGIDPDGTARFFEGMERDFGDSGREFFQTHPNPGNRVKSIRDHVAERGGTPPAALRSTPAFDAALARAREVLPYYERLNAALAGDDPEAVGEAAAAGSLALPHHAAFHFWLGVVHEAAGDRDLALQRLRAAAALDRTNVLIPVVWSVVELSAKNWTEAELAASRALAILPYLPQAYLVRGLARMRLGRTEEAFRDFDTTLELLPKGERRELEEALKANVPGYGAR